MSASTMRRRGSSLLEEAPTTSAPALPEFEAGAKKSGETSASSNALRVVFTVGLMALSAFGGAKGYSSSRVGEVQVQMEATDSSSVVYEHTDVANRIGQDMEGFRRALTKTAYTDCIADVSLCPKYTVTGYGRLLSDWPIRYTNNFKCYHEALMPANGTCGLTCDALFLTYFGANEPEWGPYVAQACHVGCSFYEKWATLGPSEASGIDCMWNCKNTVMNLDISSAKCNWNIGLGIAVFNPGQGFGAHHACEMGCLIGGARPCDILEAQTGVA